MRKFTELFKDWFGMLTQTESEAHAVRAILYKPFPATVPGCVHTDLLSAGLIEDPFLTQSEKQLKWISMSQWTYTTRFAADSELLSFENIELCCKGIDTVASIFLNDTLIGQTQSQHIEYRFDLRLAILQGENLLRIVFESPVKYARTMRDSIGALPAGPLEPYNFIRKAACNFGWDWGVTLTTVGIWRTIGIDAWNNARFKSVRPLIVQADAAKAIIKCHIDCAKQACSPLELSYKITSPSKRQIDGCCRIDSEKHILEITVDEPELWWPRGYGQQPLYSLELNLGNEDSWNEEIGLRTVRLLTDKDAKGAEFTFLINGKRIFCKGANWIPDDVFFTKVTYARYEERVHQAIDANMNMLRVWGGGIYESNEFYKICDRLGVLVWQDFLFACAGYPEEKPFAELVKTEAMQNVARLAYHPSLIIWNGCNENLWGYEEWPYQGKSWKEYIAGRSWGAGYYFEILPAIMKELDPSRPYWPGSPYSGIRSINPNNPDFGNTHTWAPFFAGHFTDYANETSRFCSEFGFQGPMSMSLVNKYIPEDAQYINSPELCHYQRNFSDSKNQNILNHLKRQFNIPEPLSVDEWVYLGQVIQARALQLAIERFRSDMPYCMGTLFWQLNDCWPAISWSALEYLGRKKLLWYKIRHLYASQLLTIQGHDGLKLCFVNDTDTIANEKFNIRLMYFDGTVIASERLELKIGPRECAKISLPSFCFLPDTPDDVVVIAENLNGLRTFWYYQPDKKLNYPFPEYEVTRQGNDIIVTAKSFLRDLTMRTDRIACDMEVNEQMVTLLPGEKFIFKINTANNDILFNNGENIFATVNTYGQLS